MALQTPSPPAPNGLAAALRNASPVTVSDAAITKCLRPDEPGDALFSRAMRDSLASLPRGARGGALSSVTGHVAESVAAIVLCDLGHELIWQLTGPGRHGVDLLMLDPTSKNVVAWEVKGTLRDTGWPRLSGRDRQQMGTDWISKAGNPGMAEWDLSSTDVSGGLAFLRFRAREIRFLITADFATFTPVVDVAELADLSWAASQH